MSTLKVQCLSLLPPSLGGTILFYFMFISWQWHISSHHACILCANLNVQSIVRSTHWLAKILEDTVTLLDSSHESNSSSTQFPLPAEDGATLNSPPDFEGAQSLWLVEPGVTILRSGFALRLPYVNMLGSSGRTSCILSKDFLRLRVIRDIKVTWGNEANLIGGSYKKLGKLLTVKKSNFIEILKRRKQRFRLTAIQVYGSHV